MAATRGGPDGKVGGWPAEYPRDCGNGRSKPQAPSGPDAVSGMVIRGIMGGPMSAQPASADPRTSGFPVVGGNGQVRLTQLAIEHLMRAR